MKNLHSRKVYVFATLFIGGFILTGCATENLQSVTPSNNKSIIQAVAAENQYGNVISQIGGTYVKVTSIINNPSTDPHSYEASTQDAIAVGQASLIVQNGVGYDQFMNKLESASISPSRTVIEVGKALGEPVKILNPHLWYKPSVMPRVALLIEKALAKIDPSHSLYFQNRLRKFDVSLSKWSQMLQKIKREYPHVQVAVTEPVADYMLQAAGLTNATPWSFQAAVMNGVDPSPQAVQYVQLLLARHQVRVLIYNLQAVDNVTQSVLQLAEKSHVPVVGVYETMPQNVDFQEWMEKEANAVYQALKNGKSSQKL